MEGRFPESLLFSVAQSHAITTLLELYPENTAANPNPPRLVLNIYTAMQLPFPCFGEDGRSSLVIRSTSETGGARRCILPSALAK